jgi:hypothetical protein
MNRKNIQVFIAFSVLVGLSAFFLARARANYVLGKPGLKVANIPTYATVNRQTNIISPTSVYLPERVLDYTSEVQHITSVELQMLPPDTEYGRRLYRATNTAPILLSVVLMGTDRTSIHKPQYCLIGAGQHIFHTEAITVPISKPHPYDLQMMKITTHAEQRTPQGVIPLRGLFLYWFVADGELTAHHGERMWLMGKNLLTRGLLQRWAYVAYWGMCSPGQEELLLARMKEFIAASVPEFQITTGKPSTQRVALGDDPFEPLSQN